MEASKVCDKAELEIIFNKVKEEITTLEKDFPTEFDMMSGIAEIMINVMVHKQPKEVLIKVYESYRDEKAKQIAGMIVGMLITKKKLGQ